MHSFGRRLKHARRHRPIAMAGKNQPREHPRYSAARSDVIKALEHALDVGFLSARPSLKELRLKPADAAQDHRLDQTLSATEVMQDRRMRNACVGGDFLKPDCLRAAVNEPALCSFQYCVPRLRSASTPPSRGPVPHLHRRSLAPGANGRWSRSGAHPF